MLQRFTDMLDDNELDVVVFPVQDNPPPFIGDWNASFVRNTYLSPMTGTPAITVPMGESSLLSQTVVHTDWCEPVLMLLLARSSSNLKMQQAAGVV